MNATATRGVERIAVVIPARDEARLLPRCLAAMRTSIEALAGAVAVRVVVVLDRCTDDSETVVRAAGIDRVVTDVGSAGAARARGIEVAVGASDPGRVWIANTDADSVVPRDWLGAHLLAAEAGADLLVGSVDVLGGDLDPRRLEEWRRRHVFTAGHEHVFGANLGVRASAYRRVGGFPAGPTGEDVALVAALRRLRAPEARYTGAPVGTSGRDVGRAPAGFAGYLAAL